MKQAQFFVVALAFSALVGCDKLSSLVGMGGKPQGGAAATVAESSGIPSRPFVPPSDILARVNEKVISKRDLEMTLLDIKASTEAMGQEWKALSVEDKADAYDLNDLLNDMIIAEMRAQDAISRGIERNIDTQYRFWHRYRTLFAQEWLADRINQMDVSQAEIDQFYQANQMGFREPEQIRVRQIIVSSEDQAKAALVKLLEGIDFVSLAAQSSIRPDAARGPLSDKWVMRAAEKAVFAPNSDEIRDLKDPVLEQAAFAVDKIGGVSSYVKGADGNYHVFQLIERKSGRQRPLLEVSDNIRNFLRLQKLAKATEELQSKVKIERFPERLSSVNQ